MSRQLMEYHPMTAYRFVPNIRARVQADGGGYLVGANGSGFRSDREFVRERTPGLRRALLFGDSFTAGDGVSNRDRYSDMLERLIDSLEVYNYGLPGSGTDQQYLAYREFARDMPTDLLVLAPLVENIRRVASRYRRFVDDRGQQVCYAKPYYVLNGAELELHHTPVPRDAIAEADLPPEDREAVDSGGRFPLARQLVNSLGARDLAARLTRYQPVPEFDDPQSTPWRVMRAILSRWIREHDGPVLLAPLPLYQHVEEVSDARPYVARFTELANETGCAFHNVLPDLQKYSGSERRAFRFARDIHPTPAGHAALAASLAPAIRALLPELNQ